MIFVFETTHHAMWAEELAKESGIPIEVIPSPPEAKAKCGIALRTLPDRVKELAARCAEEGIECRLFSEVAT